MDESQHVNHTTVTRVEHTMEALFYEKKNKRHHDQRMTCIFETKVYAKQQSSGSKQGGLGLASRALTAGAPGDDRRCRFSGWAFVGVASGATGATASGGRGSSATVTPVPS